MFKNNVFVTGALIFGFAGKKDGIILDWTVVTSVAVLPYTI